MANFRLTKEKKKKKTFIFPSMAFIRVEIKQEQDKRDFVTRKLSSH